MSPQFDDLVVGWRASVSLHRAHAERQQRQGNVVAAQSSRDIAATLELCANQLEHAIKGESPS